MIMNSLKPEEDPPSAGGVHHIWGKKESKKKHTGW